MHQNTDTVIAGVAIIGIKRSIHALIVERPMMPKCVYNVAELLGDRLGTNIFPSPIFIVEIRTQRHIK